MFAYVITNGVNGKRYVGITVNPHLRWKAHLSRAFRDTPETAAKISAGNKGKVRTQEQRERYTASMLLRPPRSAEANAKIGMALRGREFTDEHRAKLSAASKGKPKSPEHRMALAEANRARSRQLRLAV